jgi:amino acid permease
MFGLYIEQARHCIKSHSFFFFLSLSLGTFVFTFVSQHTVHLVFGSLKPNLRTVSNWKVVSTSALLTSTTVSLSVGILVYMTFGQATKSDIFQIYPQGWMIDVAKLLLCITMVLTFPLPFFTCRELLIVTLVHPFCGIGSDLVAGEDNDSDDNNDDDNRDAQETENDLQEPLLAATEEIFEDEESSERRDPEDTSSIVTEFSRRILQTATPKNWLLPDDDRQLQIPGHVILTAKLWIITTGLAIAAPSLGDVLDLVGCASGTIIAFILPALLSFRLEGYSHLALVIFVVGGTVGIVGTYFSVKKLFIDLGV